jgi:Cys-rich protein (TIGR01571 family)
MPLSVSNEMQIRQDPTEWNSGLCATPTCPRVEDCLCSFCCSLCAFSEEYVYLDQLKLNRLTASPTPEPQCCDRFCNPCACLIYIVGGVLFPIPCCFNCILRYKYRDSFKIQGGLCGDCLATFCCVCCAHAQVDHMPTPLRARPLRPPRPPRPLTTSVPLTHATHTDYGRHED